MLQNTKVGSSATAAAGRWYVHVRGCSVPPLGVPHTSGAGRVASARLASASDRKPWFPLQEHPSSIGGKGSGCLRYVRYLIGMTEWDGDLASVPSKLSALGPVLYFLPTPVPAGRQGSQAEDWAAPRAPARFGRPLGGLVRVEMANLRQGGKRREGLGAKLTVSFDCPAWAVSSSACAAQPAQLPHSTGHLQAGMLEGISFSGALEQACYLPLLSPPTWGCCPPTPQFCLVVDPKPSLSL